MCTTPNLVTQDWQERVFSHIIVCLFVCWSLTSLCHSNGHIETMPAREINPFTALTRIRSQFLRTQWSTSNHSEWTRLRVIPLSHRGWLPYYRNTHTTYQMGISHDINAPHDICNILPQDPDTQPKNYISN